MSAQEKPVSLKLFFLQVALWMPLSFYFWFVWSGVFVAPVRLVVEPILTAVLTDSLRDVYQNGYLLMIEIFFTTPPDGTRLQLNPMIYGYGLPLLSGLVISTPNPIWKRCVQLLLGWMLISMVQSWGIVFESLHQLQTWVGPDGLAVLEKAGVNAELVAFGYQFGYLILPAVTPVAAWMLFNRHFFEGLVLVRQQPQQETVETPPSDDGQLDRPE